MSTRYNSNGAVLAIDNGDSPKTYTRIAAVGDIPAVGHDTTSHDTSTHDTQGWGSIITGLKRQRPFNITVMRDPANVTHDFTTTTTGLGYLSRATPPVLKSFLLYPYQQETEADLFDGYVGSLSMPYPVDGVLTMQVQILPTGAPTHEDATGLVV